VEAAEKNSLAAKANFYPSLSFGYSLSSNFSDQFKYIFQGMKRTGVSAITPASPFVTMNNTKYYLQSPTYTATTGMRNFGDVWKGWGTQVDNNFGQSFGFQLSIPIFNGGQSRVSYQQAKLNYKSAELNQENTNRKLKQRYLYSLYQCYCGIE
jgi:outer membrane protein